MTRGYMWDSILEVLKQKAAEGVEVRLCMTAWKCLMPFLYHYPQKAMEERGIRCQDVFTDANRCFPPIRNYSDHRKVCVFIDGHTAFTGGVNLADEYINRERTFGHWKDTAIMVKGNAVKSFTMMFLQMWDAASPKSKNEENYEQFLVPAEFHKLPEGWTMKWICHAICRQPALDEEQVGNRSIWIY